MVAIRRNGQGILLVAFSALLLLFLSSSAIAGKRKKRHRKSKTARTFVLDTGLGITYDDNIINYSDDDLDLYAGGGRVSKFAIESKDDWVIVPKIEPRIKGRLLGRRRAWLKMKFQYYYYAQNDIKRYYKIGVTGRHYMTGSVYSEVEYSYIPEYYYRNQYYINDLGNGVYKEANFSKQYLKYELGMNVTKSVKADVSYRYQNKAFNQVFSERDLTVNGVRLDGVWNMSRRLKLWSYWGVERAKAKGADIADAHIKDVSYDAWDITVGGRYYARFMRKYKPEFVSTIKYRQIKYQTIKTVDAYRFGREDSNYYLRIGFAGSFPAKTRIEADYNLVMKRVDSLEDPTKISQLEYSSKSISIRIKRRF